jgi:Ubiquitin binding region
MSGPFDTEVIKAQGSSLLYQRKWQTHWALSEGQGHCALTDVCHVQAVGVDSDFLEALPPELRGEVLAEHGAVLPPGVNPANGFMIPARQAEAGLLPNYRTPSEAPTLPAGGPPPPTDVPPVPAHDLSRDAGAGPAPQQATPVEAGPSTSAGPSETPGQAQGGSPVAPTPVPFIVFKASMLLLLLP